MKIFMGQESSWQSKINFVDDNDVFVGYDMDQNCCEYADWFITETITPEPLDEGELEQDRDVESYNFDKDFFKEVESGQFDGGGMVVFKLVAENSPDLYLHLFNVHNGYYCHGFEVKHSGEIVREDYL